MRVLITGGARGIGKAIAEEFSAHGYDVEAPTRQEMDLSKEASVKEYMLRHQGETFDVIINNAGINDINDVENITETEMENMMQINLLSPIRLIQGFVGGMKQQKYGKIINIGSIWAVVSKGGRCMYSATKNGIHGVTNTLAVELAPYNILVNTVCPGFTLTELTRKNNSPEEIKEIASDIPMERMAEPSEIAKVVFFLAHTENSYVTGQKITVDGGFSAK